ncbi:sensor histidine kinase [Chitinophagaceae bacterium IBVUCB2]|nr:sensor histidine kinase [Chitinophagaceae bacterium IBVUCB2]
MTNSPFSILKFRIIFIIAWLVLLADNAMVLHFFGLPWTAAIIDSAIGNSLLFLACLLVMNTLRFYLPRGAQYINIFSICVFLTIVWLLLTKVFLKLALSHYDGYNNLLQHSLSIRFSIAFLLLGCITLISILWYNQQEQKEKDERKTDAEKLAKEAELFKLRQQLQPHFLFNSLNSINALIGSRPVEARKMVQQLSDFLRGTIRKEETQWVTFQEELQYLQLYLDIEKVRFGNRLATVIEMDASTELLKIPTLLLQPIVENAIKFGLYDTTGETIIRLYATKVADDLVIRVENPFDPETSSPKQGIGFGLQSVQRRLYLLFARTDLLVTNAKENIFTTIVKVPQGLIS